MTGSSPDAAENAAPNGENTQPFALGALLLLCVAQFVDVMDFSIVNVALPSIQQDLGASTESLQWVVSGYALTYGGLLLLGARAADLFGRRRVFLLGLSLFSAASLLGGAAQSMGMLIAARALQGIGAAMVTPAALSLITTIFTTDAERRKALSALAAVSSAAIAGGVVFGGILTDLLSWRWVLLVNVPIGVITVLLAARVLPEARNAAAPRLDLPGAVTATVGFVALLYGLTRSESAGWASVQVIGPMVVAFVLLVAFILVERRREDALVPMRLFGLRTLAGGNAVMFLSAAAFYPMFVLTSQYMQQVLAYSPLQAGLAFVPQALATAVCSGFLSARVTAAVGIRPVLTVGMTTMALGMLLLARNSQNGAFLSDVLPGTLIVAVGIGTSFTAMLGAATARVPERDQGAAAGLINSSQQIGGAVGVAVLLTIAAARTHATTGAAAPSLLGGYHAAFVVGVGLTLLAAVTALFALAGTRSTTQDPEDGELHDAASARSENDPNQGAHP